MNAIEIHNLSKSFRGMYAVDNLNMTVPQVRFMVLSAKTVAESQRPKK
jgi:ABC-type sugar transport system ATPase subunit